MKKLVLFAALLACGCSVKQRVESGWHLPPGATNVQELNHSWLSFELEGQKYMYGDIGSSESRVIIPVNREVGR